MVSALYDRFLVPTQHFPSGLVAACPRNSNKPSPYATRPVARGPPNQALRALDSSEGSKSRDVESDVRQSCATLPHRKRSSQPFIQNFGIGSIVGVGTVNLPCGRAIVLVGPSHGHMYDCNLLWTLVFMAPIRFVLPSNVCFR